MQMHPSIPRPLMAGNDLLSSIMYDSIDYKINGIFLTETAVPHNPRQVITKIGQKRKINLVMSGTIMNHVKISSSILTYEHPQDDYDLHGETVNFTFHDIRINRNPTAELYIDNNCLFYGYFRIICVNQGLIDVDDFRNISISYDELKEICNGKTETFRKYRTLRGSEWRFECKKGDSDGE